MSCDDETGCCCLNMNNEIYKKLCPSIKGNSSIPFAFTMGSISSYYLINKCMTLKQYIDDCKKFKGTYNKIAIDVGSRINDGEE